MDVRVRKPLDLSFVNSYAALPEGFRARVAPSPLAGTHLVSCSPAAAALLGLDAESVRDPELCDWLSGRRPYPAAEPVAMCYAGHQFGHYVPQLGDGRAIVVLLADILVRQLPPERELKLGVLTALVGAPFFVWLVWKERQRWF